MPGALTSTQTVGYTDFQKQQHSINAINQQNDVVLDTIVEAIRIAEEYVWTNPWGLTPQQVFDGYGLNAGQLHNHKLQMKALVNAERPGAVADNPHDATVVVNPNGTVTVHTA